MGVISVGASLGVAGERTTPAVATTTASPTARRPRSVLGTATSHRAALDDAPPPRRGAVGGGRSNSHRPVPRKAPATVNVNGSSSMEQSNAAHSAGASASASTTATMAGVEQQTAGQLELLASGSAASTGTQVLRSVSMATTMEPRVVAPHVIGTRGARINAIMSQAKCTIIYRQPEAGTSASSSRAKTSRKSSYSMNFLISADTVKRVDHGVRLLQTVIDTTEQSLRRRGPAAYGDIDYSGHIISSHYEPEQHLRDHLHDPRAASGTSRHRKECNSERTTLDERHAQARIRNSPRLQSSAAPSAKSYTYASSSDSGGSTSRSRKRTFVVDQGFFH